MGWYNTIKTAETYTFLLVKLMKEQIFPDSRFNMGHASGSSMFISDEGDLFEVRIEDAKYASDFKTPPPSNVGHALKILNRIADSGLFQNVRQTSGGTSIIGSFVPPKQYLPLAYEAPSADYKITVTHWKNSPYRSYFEETKMREAKEKAQASEPQEGIMPL